VLAGRCGECGTWGEQQHLSGTDRQVHDASVLHGSQHHVTFELVKELLARVDVVVLAGIRAADHHDDEVAVTEHALVAHGRPQLRAVGIDPLPQVECLQGLHGASVPPYVTRCGGREESKHAMDDDVWRGAAGAGALTPEPLGEALDRSSAESGFTRDDREPDT
jgi:hypothetical protein